MSAVTDSETTNGAGAKDWAEIARRAAAAEDSKAVDDLALQRELLTCVLAGSPYAIPVERVREIVRMRPVTPMPRTPDWVLGVISLRGEVVQVIDLRMCLGLATSAIGRSTRIIVLHGEDDRVAGILVDGVRDAVGQINSSLHGQSEACTQVVGFLDQVEERTRSNDDSVRSMSEAMDGLTSEAVALRGEVARFQI